MLQEFIDQNHDEILEGARQRGAARSSPVASQLERAVHELVDLREAISAIALEREALSVQEAVALDRWLDEAVANVIAERGER